jgi:hypothetical protein
MRPPDQLVLPQSWVGARCAQHPERSAAACCERCGAFHCREEQRELEGKFFCGPCAARPEFDPLAEVRQRYWGRLSGGAVFVGLVGLTEGLLALGTVLELPLLGAAMLISAGLKFQFFTGRPRWVRLVVPLTPFLMAAGFMVHELLRTRDPDALARHLGASLLSALFAFFFLGAVAISPITRLFFKIEVPRPALNKIWKRHQRSPIARQALGMAIIGLFLPVLVPISAGLAVYGLVRKNPEAFPPVGRRGFAVAALVLNALSLAFHLTRLWIYFQGR